MQHTLEQYVEFLTSASNAEDSNISVFASFFPSGMPHLFQFKK
jgi:hypothetical protein